MVYLGHKIDAEDLHPVANKVDAIQGAPGPKNVAELKLYICWIAVNSTVSFYPTCQPFLPLCTGC